jgi:hypothetical protein
VYPKISQALIGIGVHYGIQEGPGNNNRGRGGEEVTVCWGEGSCIILMQEKSATMEISVVETHGEGECRGQGDVVLEITSEQGGILRLEKGKSLLPQTIARINLFGVLEEARKAVGNSAESMWTVVVGQKLVGCQLSPSKGAVILDLKSSQIHRRMWPLGCLP